MEKMKGQETQAKDNKETIQDKISSLRGQLELTEQYLEPLYKTWEKFMTQINATRSGIRLLKTEKAIQERKLRIKELEEERDKDPDVKKMNTLREMRNEIQDEISKLSREQYENSLNELKSEVSELSDKAYKELDSLTKEHIDPLIKEYGMTEEAAKSQLKSEVSNLIDNLEEKINIYEQIQSDIEQFLADKNQGHDIERLKNQLKKAEHFH